MKGYLCFSIFVVFIVSCSNNNVKKQISINKGNITAIKPNVYSNKISIFDVFEEIEIIPLEMTDVSLLSAISKIDIDDTTFFIQNLQDKLVYLFDLNGNYKCKIGNIGIGPEELGHPNKFVLNKNKKEIWISDNYQEILKYDYSGKFQNKMELKLFYDDIYVSDKEFIYFFTSKKTNFNKTGGYDCWELWIKNPDLQGYKVHFSYDYKNYPNGKPYMLSYTTFSRVNDLTTFHYIYSDTIYSIKDDIVENRYVVDFGERKIKKNLSAQSFEQQMEYMQEHKDEAGFVNGVMETINNLIFSYLVNMQKHYVFYNKKSNKIIEGIVDDIYGSEIRFMLANNNEIIGYFMPDNIDFSKANDWQLNETEISKLKSLPEDANPVLIKCKLKY
jgi:hypothetical protein